jgi:heptosyltransferase-2
VADARKLLIVGPSWIGDMVMAQSLYKLLRSQDARTEIHVIAPAWSKPILERMPEVSRAIEVPVVHGELGLAKRRRLGRRLRAEEYTGAIILPRSLKSALLPFFAAVPVRTGFRGEWRYGLINDMRPFDPQRLDQTVKRFVALGLRRGEEQLPVMENPSLRVDPEAKAAARTRLGLNSTAEIVALMPGAEYGPAKRWPLQHYADLASRLVGVGIEVWVLGSEKERGIGESLRGAVDDARVHNLCGKTSLGEVVDLLSSAKVAVTNDSGLMHVAAAVRTHVVALYGSSSPQFTPPLTDAKDVFYRALDCSPCFERCCPLAHLECLRGIPVDSVCSSVVTALGGPQLGAYG